MFEVLELVLYFLTDSADRFYNCKEFVLFEMIAKLFLIFTVCTYKISCDFVNVTEAIEQCSPKFNVSKNDPDLEHLFKNGEFPPGKETKKCFFECVLRNVDIVDSNFVPNEKKVMVFLERINSAGHLNSTQMAEFSDLVGKICLPPKDLSSPCNIAYNFMICVFDIMKVIDIMWIIDHTDILNSISIKDVYSKNIVSAVNSCKRVKKFGY